MHNIGKIVGMVLAFILLAGAVEALGVSPTKVNLDFEANTERDITLRIINNEHKDMRVAVSVRGSLAEYIEIPQAIVTLTPEEEMKSITYRVKLPTSLDKPGTHASDIVVIEIPAADDVVVVDNKAYITTDSGMQIVPVISIAQRLHVNVPFPGTYAEADLRIQEADVNQNVHFTLPISNFGTNDLGKVSGRIKILTPTYEELAEITTTEISLKSKQKGKIVGSWKADVNPGVYIARAIVTYDGNTISLEKQFSVGSLLLTIEDVIVNDFILGGVARFDIVVESLWNKLISDVFAEMTVTDKEGNEMTRFKSAVIDISPLAQETIQAFWDTQGVKVGPYDVKLILNYAGKTTEKTMEIQVNIDSISTDLGTGAVVADGGLIKRDTILIIGIIILVIMNISWLVYVRKRSKKEEKD